jgi:hypothetical protein
MGTHLGGAWREHARRLRGAGWSWQRAAEFLSHYYDRTISVQNLRTACRGMQKGCAEAQEPAEPLSGAQRGEFRDKTEALLAGKPVTLRDWSAIDVLAARKRGVPFSNTYRCADPSYAQRHEYEQPWGCLSADAQARATCRGDAARDAGEADETD